MAKNVNSISKKDMRLKNIFDLLACELCSVSVALIIDCLAFFGYFGSIATPIVFICLLFAVSVGSIVLRQLYIKKIGYVRIPTAEELVGMDRMRFTKNTASSTLCYFAILFNVLYFANVYSSDVGNYYYSITIGLSVVYNLLFLLFTFLCSEGVKNYSKGYSIFVSIIGAMQIVRIFYIPLKAHSTTISLDGVNTVVMDDKQFTLVVIYLVVSAACCLAAGAIGYHKTTQLENYKKETGLG